jgi:hypothetical protein
VGVNDLALLASYCPLMKSEEATMKPNTTKRRGAATVAIAAIGLVGAMGGAVTGDASALNATETPVPFAPYETGALAGTSETYVDMREDGSYYDPSLGRRVFPAR